MPTLVSKDNQITETVIFPENNFQKYRRQDFKMTVECM